jgi:hypothetical protein
LPQKGQSFGILDDFHECLHLLHLRFAFESAIDFQDKSRI